MQFSADGGRTWADADLHAPASFHGWTGWWYPWDASEPGGHEPCVRATDARDEIQPLDAGDVWNQGGYGVNAVQCVLVRVWWHRRPAVWHY